MLLAIALLASLPQASAVITVAYDQLRVLHSQQSVSMRNSGVVSCTESLREAELLRVTRAQCERLARADVEAAQGRVINILNVGGRLTRSGRLHRLYDGSIVDTDCSVEDFTFQCEVDVLVGTRTN